MKALVICLLIFGFDIPGFPQFISKGSIIGNGSVTYKSTRNGQDYSTQFSLLPWVGFLITDNFVLGGGIDFESSSSKGNVNIYTGSTNASFQNLSYDYFTKGFAIGPVVRYYFNGGLFLQTSILLVFKDSLGMDGSISILQIIISQFFEVGWGMLSK